MQVAPVTDIDSYIGSRIMLEMPEALRFWTITEAIADGLDHRLTISSNLGEPVATRAKVHFLTCARTDADRIEIQHAVVASEVSTPSWRCRSDIAQMPEVHILARHQSDKAGATGHRL